MKGGVGAVETAGLSHHPHFSNQHRILVLDKIVLLEHSVGIRSGLFKSFLCRLCRLGSFFGYFLGLPALAQDFLKFRGIDCVIRSQFGNLSLASTKYQLSLSQSTRPSP